MLLSLDLISDILCLLDSFGFHPGLLFLFQVDDLLESGGVGQKFLKKLVLIQVLVDLIVHLTNVGILPDRPLNSQYLVDAVRKIGH